MFTCQRKSLRTTPALTQRMESITIRSVLSVLSMPNGNHKSIISLSIPIRSQFVTVRAIPLATVGIMKGMLAVARFVFVIRRGKKAAQFHSTNLHKVRCLLPKIIACGLTMKQAKSSICLETTTNGLDFLYLV